MSSRDLSPKSKRSTNELYGEILENIVEQLQIAELIEKSMNDRVEGDFNSNAWLWFEQLDCQLRQRVNIFVITYFLDAFSFLLSPLSFNC